MKMAFPIYHYNIEQGSDEWHALRRGMITAFAVSCLLTATGKPANNDTSRAQLLKLMADDQTPKPRPIRRVRFGAAPRETITLRLFPKAGAAATLLRRGAKLKPLKLP